MSTRITSNTNQSWWEERVHRQPRISDQADDSATKLYAFACGWLNADASTMLARATGRISFPIPAYLIVHPLGSFLFDTGMHPSVGQDPASRLGSWSSIFKMSMPKGQDLASQLSAMNVDPNEISLIASSHLHFTHAGGFELFPNAKILTQRKEWDAAHDPDLMRANNYNPQDYDHHHVIQLLDGSHDIFGDQKAVLIPCPGHTPGSQALLLKLSTGTVLLTSDACYFRETLDDLRLPNIVFDRSQALDSLMMFRDYQRSGVRIFYGHDATFWKTIPHAPCPIT